jgi:radical SAM superfamily enzyme
MLRETFGEKVYKVTLNGGMSCPNRDGKIGKRGCIFCSAGGRGDFAADAALSITEQINSQIRILRTKRPIRRFIAYFQAYTNTYASVDISGKFLPKRSHIRKSRHCPSGHARTASEKMYLSFSES